MDNTVDYYVWDSCEQCEVRPNCKGKPETRCIDCNKKMCNCCNEYHCAFHKDHEVTKLNDTSGSFICKHTDQMELYCTKCDTPLCLTCKSKFHSGHWIEDINNVVEKTKILYKEIQKKCSDEYIGRLKQHFENHKEESEQTKKDISDFVDGLKTTLDRKKEEMFKQSEMIVEKKKIVFEQQFALYKQHQEVLKQVPRQLQYSQSSMLTWIAQRQLLQSTLHMAEHQQILFKENNDYETEGEYIFSPNNAIEEYLNVISLGCLKKLSDNMYDDTRCEVEKKLSDNMYDDTRCEVENKLSDNMYDDTRCEVESNDSSEVKSDNSSEVGSNDSTTPSSLHEVVINIKPGQRKIPDPTPGNETATCPVQFYDQTLERSEIAVDCSTGTYFERTASVKIKLPYRPIPTVRNAHNNPDEGKPLMCGNDVSNKADEHVAFDLQPKPPSRDQKVHGRTKAVSMNIAADFPWARPLPPTPTLSQGPMENDRTEIAFTRNDKIYEDPYSNITTQTNDSTNISLNRPPRVTSKETRKLTKPDAPGNLLGPSTRSRKNANISGNLI